ncbi:hypothetical protein Pcinc_025847 [Petrolisthes cinctipes]|uniref:Ionotropic glutamate receptor L-glutamate and glycine-binding domain-containing protein n=1 Tax=Petrolisthes cinctipes TaxID=88211 RepID=A0AAE1KB00_PETCI|nr:hypothetical protein Pcinc_025847 [Petrolisthes cinctipes]
MSNMLRDALKQRDFSDDANILAKAAKITKNEIFDHEGFRFTGSFTPNCQEESVPASLKSPVSIKLNGCSSLERAELWKLHNTHVVMLGPREGMEARLFQDSLRNAISCLYLLITQTSSPPRHTHRITNAVKQGRFRTMQITILQCVKERVWVYRRCMYCQSGQPEVQFLFQWNLAQQHLDHFNQYLYLMDDPLSDFRGHTFRVATIAYFPYIDYKRDREEPGTTVTPLDSINVRILDTLADSLNFTYKIREDPNRSFGNIDADGNYNGMSGQLQREEVDFSFSLAPTPGRLRVMDFIRFMPPDAFVVTSLKPSFLPANLALVRPFSRTSLCMILL